MTEYCRHISSHGAAAGLGDTRFALPGSAPKYAPDRQLRSRHVRLEIRVDLGRRAAEATCVTTMEAIHDGAAEMTFDAVGFKLGKVGVRPGSATHRYDGRKLSLTLGRPLAAGERVDVSVAYRVEKPPLGMWFVGPDKDHPGTPTQMWTQCQDEFARYWFPCHDAPQEKATTEMIATVPEGFFALSNGELVSRRASKKDRTSTFHWRLQTPHSPYLVTLAVGRFVEIADAWDGIPVTYYVERGREEDARRAFALTPAMMQFFSERTGMRYPYEKYAQVAVSHFIYGGMENTSATTQTDLVLHDARAHAECWHDGLVAHELAHQWFGDLLTCKDWSQAWLNEGFATYFDALFQEHHRGVDELRHQMWDNRQKYLGEDREHYRRPIVTHVWKDSSDVFDHHLYEKGSWVLHMLRAILGDDLWWRGIQRYVKDNAGGTVETADLVNAFQEATGRNLRWFFDQWVHRAGHPSLRVAYSWDARKKEASVWVAQVQPTSDETPVFRVPLTLELRVPGGKVLRFQETVTGREHTFTYKVAAEPDLFLLDPDHAVLMEAEVSKPPSMWRTQLTVDPHVVGRMDAAEALGRLGSPEATAVLGQALLQERFWGVQVEIARALGRIRTGDAYKYLLQGLAIGNVKARRGVVEALGEMRRPELADVLKPALGAMDSYLVPAEACRALGRSGAPSALPVLREHLGVSSWNETIRCGALDGLAALGTEQALSLLAPHTRPSHAHVVRAAAVRALCLVGRGRQDVVDHVLRLADDADLRVRMAVLRGLGQLGDPRALPALRKAAAQKDVDGRLRRAADESIQRIRKGLDEDKART